MASHTTTPADVAGPAGAGPAAASAPKSRDPPPLDVAKLAVLKSALYEACRNSSTSDSHIFTQSDLLNLNVIPARNASLLLKILQSLSDDRLFVPVNTPQGLGWRWRDEDEAQK